MTIGTRVRHGIISNIAPYTGAALLHGIPIAYEHLALQTDHEAYGEDPIVVSGFDQVQRDVDGIPDGVSAVRQHTFYSSKINKGGMAFQNISNSDSIKS